MTALHVCLTTLAAAFVSGFVPILNIEAYLIGAAALLPDCPALLVVVPATIGQMAAKAILYLGATYRPCRRGSVTSCAPPPRGFPRPVARSPASSS